MEKEKAYKLADALESGKYKQGQSALRNEKNEFCCLGVACDIANAQWSEEPRAQTFQIKVYTVEGGNFNMIPRQLFKATGFSTVGGKLKKTITVRRKNGMKQKYDSLWKMNDNGLSFKFIAKILRKHYKDIA